MNSVLIVEDEDALLEMLGKTIERRGFKVFKARNAAEALSLYQQNKPDGVILDVRLPDTNGGEVFLKIKEINPQAFVYFVTGSDNQALKEEMQKLGANGFLVKPITVPDILAIIEKIGKPR